MAVRVLSVPAPTRAQLDTAAGLCCRCHSRKLAPKSKSRCEVCLERERLQYQASKSQTVSADPDDGTILLRLTLGCLKAEGIDLLPELVALAKEKGIEC